MVKKVPRPGRWWREPLPASYLKDIPEDEAKVLIVQERALRVAQYQDKLRKLREFSRDFDAADGYPLDSRKLVRLPAAKLKKINTAYRALQTATASPYITIEPRGANQEKAAIRHAGTILPGQKKYILHTGEPQITKAEFVTDRKGIVDIKVTTKAKGVDLYRRIYFFKRRPSSWNSVVKQTEELIEDGMRTGFYKIYNSVHGAIGGLVQREKLIEELESFYATYNRYLAGTILGWQWTGNSLDAARKRQRKKKTVSERFQENRERLRKKELERQKRRVGYTWIYVKCSACRGKGLLPQGGTCKRCGGIGKINKKKKL